MLVKVNHPSPQKCKILHISPHPCAKIPYFSAFLNLQTTFLRPRFWGSTMPWCRRMKPSRSSWCPTVSWCSKFFFLFVPLATLFFIQSFFFWLNFSYHRATGEGTRIGSLGSFPKKRGTCPSNPIQMSARGSGFKCGLFSATETWRWFFPDLTLRIILRLGLHVQVPQRLDNIHSIPITNCRDRKNTKKNINLQRIRLGKDRADWRPEKNVTQWRQQTPTNTD